MAMRKLCGLGELAEAEMRDFTVDRREIVVLWPRSSGPVAYDARCPHEGVSLAFGEFDGERLVCGAHQWVFDGATGAGIFPKDCRLAAYPLQIVGEDVYVELTTEEAPRDDTGS